MTIDEAIKELGIAVRAAERRTAWKRVDALKLSIEALGKWKERHDRCPDDINFLLPGETEE